MGEHDTLYGSVTSADIADALTALGITVDRRKIQLPDPLKALGEHAVPIKLHRELTVPSDESKRMHACRGATC